MDTIPEVESRLDELRAHMRSLGSVLVCFSGGIDSALLLAVATEQLPGRAVGMLSVSPSLAPLEQADAERIAHSLGADLRLVPSFEMQRPEYVKNDADRCLHCKTELYRIASAKLAEWGLSTILNGTNTDDLSDYRPGTQAARDAGVRMPFLELGFNKSDVRLAAREFGLDDWNKPASACLSSRIPYGVVITPERLSQVGGFEAALRHLGLRQVRVRWHEALARIEVPLEDAPRLVEPALRERILAAGRAQGFTFITLDLMGYRQGSHNELLAQDKKSSP